ncbi:MAG: TIGR04086 family membrane protein [Clostridia bacterium]
MNKLKYFGLNLGICYLLILFLLLVSSLIFAYTNINDNYLNIFVYSIIGISVFITSILLNRKIKTKGALYGLIFGLSAIIIIYLIGLIFIDGFSLSYVTLTYISVSTIAGIIGGIIGVNL